MKTLVALLFFEFFFAHVFAQEKKIDEKKVPQSVINYLRQNYTDAKELEYYQKKEKDSILYEVEFELAKQVYNLKFSLRGVLIETEREIEFEDLDHALKQNILGVLKTNFQKVRIKKTQEVNPSGRKQFEVGVKVKKSEKFQSGFYKVMFDADGNLLRIEEEVLESIESVF